MNHSLISPLAQEGRNRIVPPIQNKQQRRRRRLSKVPQLGRFVHLVQHLGAQFSRETRHAFVADYGALFERKEESGETFDVSREGGGGGREDGGRFAVEGHCGLGWGRVERCREDGEGEVGRGEGGIVGEEFLECKMDSLSSAYDGGREGRALDEPAPHELARARLLPLVFQSATSSARS